MSEGAVQQILAALEEHKDILDRLDAALYRGNGRPSVMERLRAIEDAHAACPARLGVGRRYDRLGLLFAGISSLVALGALLLSLVR